MQFLLLIAVVLAGAAGDVCVARAMKSAGELASFHPLALLRFAAKPAADVFLWMGIFWKAVAFFTLLALLDGTDLSWVVPATAVSFVIELVAAKLFLGEHINRQRWIGALSIAAGVAMISL